MLADGAVERFDLVTLANIEAVTADEAKRLADFVSAGGGLVIFTGDNEGDLIALDSRTGEPLWSYQMGATMWGASAITYMLDGRQYVLAPAGTTLTAWALFE